ncbi:MAG: prepilin-type N-terminal cleavage/methylation domain-containing protein, partial [Proteobacteria bacterium]|nr:prepilin-type N-terminal cleavage/methylation domain-containing protein [Pseudomonadota bacterium]
MLNSQKGFTLIELIMVIVILGVLAVVAVPKYQDLSTE